MKNVLLLVTKDDVGGAQKYVRDLADNLNKSLFQVKILTGGKGGQTDLDFKEFLIFPSSAFPYHQSYQISVDLYQNLQEGLQDLLQECLLYQKPP